MTAMQGVNHILLLNSYTPAPHSIYASCNTSTGRPFIRQLSNNFVVILPVTLLDNLAFRHPINYWNQKPGSCCNSFIHSFEDLYSTSSRKLLRGDPDSSTVKRNSFQLIIECV